MAYEVVPAVQAVLDVFPEKKKDGFDRVMDVAHLIMDGMNLIIKGKHKKTLIFPVLSGDSVFYSDS